MVGARGRDRGWLRGAALVALLVSAPDSLLACECASASLLVSSLQRREDRDAEVFLGRVARILSPREAEVEVLESFSGTGGLKRLRSRDSSSCAVGFGAGQRHVYAPATGGLVDLCSRHDPSPEFLDRLRAARRPWP